MSVIAIHADAVRFLCPEVLDRFDRCVPPGETATGSG
jgi:hypothetical protein